MNDAKYCKDCKNINCPETRVNCKYPDAIACELYRDTPPTLFDQITQSYETLAQKLVYEESLIKPDGTYVCRYFSTIIDGGCWLDEEEAIAATVAELKEVYNG